MIISEWPMALKNELSINRKMKWLIISIFAMFMAVGAVSATDGYFAFDTSGYLNKVSDIRNPSGTILNLTGGLRYDGVNVCLNGGSYNFSEINDVIYINPNSGSDLYAKLNGANNQDFYIPCGIYELEQQINLGKNVTIKGSGFCTKIIPANSFTGEYIFYMGNSSVQGTIDPNTATTLVQHTTIENIYFDGNKDNTINVGLLFTNYSQEFKIKDNWFKNFEIDVLHFRTSKKVEIEGNWFGGSGSSFTGGDILDISTGGDFTVVNNHFLDFTGATPIKITANSNKIIISGNVFYSGTNQAIIMGSTGSSDESRGIIISNNVFASISGSQAIINNGINVFGVQITDNFFRNMEYGALKLRGKQFTISDNFMNDICKNASGDNAAGIWLKDNATEFKITGNTINGGGSCTYMIANIYNDDAKDQIISDNIVSGGTAFFRTGTLLEPSMSNNLYEGVYYQNNIKGVQSINGFHIKEYEVNISTTQTWYDIDTGNDLRYRGNGLINIISDSTPMTQNYPTLIGTISKGWNSATGSVSYLSRTGGYLGGSNAQWLEVQWLPNQRLQVRLNSTRTDYNGNYKVIWMGFGEYTT